MSNFVSFCKYYHLIFIDFSFISNIFFKINEISNLVSLITTHMVRVLCLSLTFSEIFHLFLIFSLNIMNIPIRFHL